MFFQQTVNKGDLTTNFFSNVVTMNKKSFSRQNMLCQHELETDQKLPWRGGQYEMETLLHCSL